MAKTLIGADPELFVGKNNVPLSAYGLVQGTKQNPYPVMKGAVQVDGMALEFNIDPAETEEQFVENIDAVLTQLKQMVPDYEFLEVASVEFDEDYIRTQPYEALELGCEPDYNAYLKCINERPNAASNMRTAGGHLHIGMRNTNNIWDADHVDFCEKMARLMDEEVGVYSILWDKDDKRRGMYGKASTFRPKFYGMEYRSMSNAWMFKPSLRRLVYNLTMNAVKRYEASDFNFNDDVVEIINSSDRSNKFFENNDKVALVNQALAA